MLLALVGLCFGRHGECQLQHTSPALLAFRGKIGFSGWTANQRGQHYTVQKELESQSHPTTPPYLCQDPKQSKKGGGGGLELVSWVGQHWQIKWSPMWGGASGLTVTPSPCIPGSPGSPQPITILCISTNQHCAMDRAVALKRTVSWSSKPL